MNPYPREYIPAHEDHSLMSAAIDAGQADPSNRGHSRGIPLESSSRRRSAGSSSSRGEKKKAKKAAEISWDKVPANQQVPWYNYEAKSQFGVASTSTSNGVSAKNFETQIVMLEVLKSKENWANPDADRYVTMHNPSKAHSVVYTLYHDRSDQCVWERKLGPGEWQQVPIRFVTGTVFVFVPKS
ncbi:hypothetical protein PTTG_01292 [Puccinia triticina 1-1 BBBD Race 1]|uniref:Uncharacterized protein n=1 Tax=Puccinia triticina (isolate 1-1 / race 1 (BBBD)) TaxID=630390 RepID=A0A0C4EKL6_PUCT1|nr:hypothetical protein PTTG_01292 [Puccinia triticina 1-1 BBBD Race 1]